MTEHSHPIWIVGPSEYVPPEEQTRRYEEARAEVASGSARLTTTVCPECGFYNLLGMGWDQKKRELLGCVGCHYFEWAKP